MLVIGALFVDSKDGEGAGSFHIVETDENGNKKYDQVWDKNKKVKSIKEQLKSNVFLSTLCY